MIRMVLRASGPGGLRVPGFALVAWLALLPGCAHRFPTSMPCRPSLDDLAWLTGRWSGSSPEGMLDEQWTTVAGNSMLGIGRLVTGSHMVSFEYLRIEQRPDGIYYIAHPGARPGVEFKLTQCETHQARFENPAHDHPKRIVYRRNRDGSLTARIEGDKDGHPIAEEFVYRPQK